MGKDESSQSWFLVFVSNPGHSLDQGVDYFSTVMTNNHIRVKSFDLCLKLGKQVFLVFAAVELSVGDSSKLLEVEGVRNTFVSIGFALNLVIIAKEIADCIDMQFVNSVCIEELFQLHLGWHHSLYGNTHHSHIGSTRYLVDDLQKLGILNLGAN